MVDQNSPADSPSGFSKGYLGYALAIVLLANIINYLDRMVVSGLELEIKAQFGITEGSQDAWKYGLLWTAFTVGYMLTSPVIGYFADRWRRTRMFAGCVLLWSLATIGCGLATNYWFFLAMRVLTGVGEAGCLVIGPTLLADYFPPAQRGRILAILFLGAPLGGALGYVTAGQAGWHAFYYAGFPGIPIALAIYLLAEPTRGASEQGLAGSHAPAATSNNLASYLALFKIRTLRYIILAQAFAAFTLVPLMHFGIGYFEDLQMEKKTVTNTLGVLVFFGGIGGAVIGGLLGDKLRKTDPGAYALLAGLGFLIGFPSMIAALYLAPHMICFVALFVTFTAFFMCMPLVNTQIANSVPATQRALAFAAAVFVLHVLGDFTSPPLFEFISAKIGPGDIAATSDLASMAEMRAAARLKTFVGFSFSLLLSSMFCFMAWRAAQTDTQTSTVEPVPAPEG